MTQVDITPSRTSSQGGVPAARTWHDLRVLTESVLEDGKADDVVCIDLAGKSTIADYMIIASGRSARHVGALAENLTMALKRAEAPRLSVEGERRADWILIDAGDVIVHLFQPETRLFYSLEKMWAAPPAESA